MASFALTHIPIALSDKIAVKISGSGIENILIMSIDHRWWL
jgi:hypothetical protein